MRGKVREWRKRRWEIHTHGSKHRETLTGKEVTCNLLILISTGETDFHLVWWEIWGSQIFCKWQKASWLFCSNISSYEERVLEIKPTYENLCSFWHFSTKSPVMDWWQSRFIDVLCSGTDFHDLKKNKNLNIYFPFN